MTLEEQPAGGGLALFTNYREGDKKLIKPCCMAVTSTFPSSSSPGGAQGLHPWYQGCPDHRVTLDVRGGFRLSVCPSPVRGSLVGLPHEHGPVWTFLGLA